MFRYWWRCLALQVLSLENWNHIVPVQSNDCVPSSCIYKIGNSQPLVEPFSLTLERISKKSYISNIARLYFLWQHIFCQTAYVCTRDLILIDCSKKAICLQPSNFPNLDFNVVFTHPMTSHTLNKNPAQFLSVWFRDLKAQERGECFVIAKIPGSWEVFSSACKTTTKAKHL